LPHPITVHFVLGVRLVSAVGKHTGLRCSWYWTRLSNCNTRYYRKI